MNKLFLAISLSLLGSIVSWWQLNGQFVWKNTTTIWNNIWTPALLGIPLSIVAWLATRYSYEYFGATWNLRLIGFSIGTLVFTLCSYYFLNEVPNNKTILCIVLATLIILIQITNLR